jgi:hypothetical protein
MKSFTEEVCGMKKGLTLARFWFEKGARKNLSAGLPTEDGTEEARQALADSDRSRKDPYSRELQWFFSIGQIQIGSLVTVGGRALFFVGAYPEMEFPQALVFYDPSLKRHVQFYGEILSPVKVFSS